MLTFVHGETNVTLACMNHCVSCNHLIPLQSPWYADPAVVERDLHAAAQLMHFGVYNLVGGEPTLHPQLVEIAGIIRRSGICDRIELTSNGQNAERWPDALYDLIDDLAITPYKITQAERDLIAAKCVGKRAQLSWHFVGFTAAAYRQANGVRGANLYRNCWYRANRQVIDEGYFYRCCVGSFITKVLLGHTRQDDGIAIEGLTEERLREFMAQPKAPPACSICGSNSAPFLGWHEQSDRQLWLEESLA